VRPISESLKLAIESWQQGGWLDVYPPADPERIHAVMQTIGQRPSADVVELYTTTGGFGGMCKHGLTLWSLEEILQNNAGIDNPRWAFADGLIESFRFRLQYENELVSSVWVDHGGDFTYEIAPSLEEFFHLYTNGKIDDLL
jgi:hypothetical protein